MEPNRVAPSSLVAARLGSYPVGTPDSSQFRVIAANDCDASDVPGECSDLPTTAGVSEPSEDEVRVALENVRAASAATGDVELAIAVGSLTRARVLLEVGGHSQGAPIDREAGAIALYRP